MFAANFLLAWGAATLARLIYHLAAQVKAAREMGGYELIEQLGRGGMGEVWRAEHRIVGRQAAVKLIRADVLAQIGSYGALVKRFRIEAEANARLHSPHTVALYDYGINEDVHGSANVDARADIYGLGCVAYWLLTGRLVFEFDTAMATALAHVRDQPVPPSQRSENEVPVELDRIVLDCLAKNPDLRPQSALDLRQALAACPVVPWTREMAEDWWRAHMPIGSDSDLTPVPATLKH